MEKVIHAQVRERVGKTAARQVRSQGNIPCVIYGEGSPTHVVISAREFNKNFKVISESTLISIDINGKIEQVLVKDFQENIVRGSIEHMDFLKVSLDKPIRTHVPIHLIGTPVGAKEGGVLEMLVHTVDIECLPKDLPEYLEADVSSLLIGQTFHLKELKVPAGVTLHGSVDMGLAHVTHAKSAYVESTAAAETAVVADTATEEKKA